jgi:site-specific DNA recombinase
MPDNDFYRINYAIWAAVSTEQQAADNKFSLQSQVESSREYVKGKGWLESAGPYVVPGESRSRWVSLHEAAEAIPALRQLLEDARQGKFDVLVMREYDRFRDLIDLVAMTLNHYGVQLYSISQQAEPLNPNKFTPYASDTEQAIREISKISSRMAINSMRRKYFEQMPERVRSLGLNAISAPYGYRKPVGHETDRKAVLEQIPEVIPFIIQAKDMFLSGKSLRQITAWLTEAGAPTPGGGPIWHSRTLRDILTNPFYAGFVRFGMTRTYYDLLDGNKQKRDKRINPDRMITAVGKHEPTWDEATYNAILAELHKRPRNYRGQISHRLTGLLACHECGARLHMHYRYRKGEKNNAITWRCSVGLAAHVSVYDEIMLEKAIEAIIKHLHEDVALSNQQVDTSLDDELIDLEARKKRIDDAYEAGVMDLSTYSTRARELKAKIADVADRANKRINVQAESDLRNHAISYLLENEKDLASLIRHGEQQYVNHILRGLDIELVVDHDGTVINIVRKKTGHKSKNNV